MHLEAGPQCIGQQELEGRVARLPSAAELDVSVRVVVRLRPLSPCGVHADVEVSTEDAVLGGRSVETANSDCRDIDDALLVVIDALLSTADLPPVKHGLKQTQPKLVDRQVAQATSPPAETSNARPISRTHPSSAPSRTTPREPLLITAGVAYARGVVPGAAAVVRADTRLAIVRPLALWFGVGVTPAASVLDMSSVEVGFRSVSARALACWDPWPSQRWHLDVCAGVDAGAVIARQTGLTGNTSTTRPAAWPLVDLSASWTLLGPLVVEPFTAAGPALIVETYAFEDAEGHRHAIYDGAPWRWELGLSLGAALP